MRSAPVARVDLDADQRAAHCCVSGADTVVVGGRKFHAACDRGARICRRPCARPAHRCRRSMSARRRGRSPATTPSGRRRAPSPRSRHCAHAPWRRSWATTAAANPASCSCPSFQRAASHCLAVGSVGAIPHRSSAAGHSPKRNMTRAASAAACVPTCAPFEADGGSADRRHPARIFCRGVLRRLVHRVGIARGDERERRHRRRRRARVTSSATPPRWAATRLASAVPMPLPIST